MRIVKVAVCLAIGVGLAAGQEVKAINKPVAEVTRLKLQALEAERSHREEKLQNLLNDLRKYVMGDVDSREADLVMAACKEAGMEPTPQTCRVQAAADETKWELVGLPAKAGTSQPSAATPKQPASDKEVKK